MKRFKLTYVPTFRNNLDINRCVCIRTAESYSEVVTREYSLPDSRDWMLSSVEELK